MSQTTKFAAEVQFVFGRWPWAPPIMGRGAIVRTGGAVCAEAIDADATTSTIAAAPLRVLNI